MYPFRVLTPDGFLLLGFDVFHKAGNEFPRTNQRFANAAIAQSHKWTEIGLSTLPRRARNVRFWQIVLQKSFCTDDQKFCELQARISCKDVRDLIASRKTHRRLRNAIEVIRIGDYFPFCVFARKSRLCNFRLLQHNLPETDMEADRKMQ